MTAKQLNQLVNQIETHIECWKQFNHFVNVARAKKFGPQDGLLSFPMPGYTLSLDFPMRPGLLPFLDQLDAMVLKRGGRLYLAKDARMSPAMFHAGYPRLAEWRAIKAAVDPNNRFSSSLSRRLEMGPA